MKKTPAVEVLELEGGQLLRLTIQRPPGNILDAEVVLELLEAFRGLSSRASVKAVVLAGAGEHFCYGASVQEHRSEQVEGMLRRFHELVRTIVNSGVVLLVAVRGQCLGGGLELALFGQRVFSCADAHFGQPEIRLGVFAPIASLFLADRIGRAAADELLLSGKTIRAEEALGLGLVDELCDDPERAALDWFRNHLAAHSASSLCMANRAARFELQQRLESNLAGIEQLYLDELMPTEDAEEGIEAFLAKRKPTWRDE